MTDFQSDHYENNGEQVFLIIGAALIFGQALACGAMCVMNLAAMFH